MRDRIVTLLPLLLASVLGALVYLLNQFSVVELGGRRPSPLAVDMVASGAMVVRLNERGMPLSRIQAKDFQHIPKDDTMLFTAPVLYHSPPGQPLLTVVGEKARAVHKGDEVFFTGQVLLTRAAAPGGAELRVRSSEIWVDTKNERARSSQPVVADQGPHHAEAVGFVADHRQETLELLSQVRMTYVPTARAALGGIPAR
ncbi:LPS export ABC transporter periplasmic protein LptC [Chitinilyticum litopenaei]|uniref:LPS export ABC transporter periplasmic protein LptC n=1 Tax=Chitinilyticum litopenaei TaxID=1121276 RepID=UPI00040FB559|nr:LPS export ABC transporter periplasmic protein LptC [Chitinilyticum litopenaei]